MEKKPEAKGTKKTSVACCAPEIEIQTITVTDGDKTPFDELMKLPKAQIARSIAIPENKTRFRMDVDNRTAQGKGIIALMEALRDGDSAALKTVAGILGALAGMLAKKPSPSK